MRIRILSLMFVVTLVSASPVPSQESLFSARVTDRDGNQYLLDSFKRYEYEFFNCRMRDAPFKLSFEQIGSIDFLEEPDASLKGYTRANVTLTDGSTSAVYFSSESVFVKGTESNFAVELSIPLEELQTIAFVRE